MHEKIPLTARISAAIAGFTSGLHEEWGPGRAHLNVKHGRPKDWKRDAKTGLLVPDVRWVQNRKTGLLEPDFGGTVELLSEDESQNLITNVGRIQLHRQGYGTSGLDTNGFNYIALSNDTVSETASSTVLSNEIATNGLSRAQGTVTLPTGAGNQTTISRVFTASGTQAAQKAALLDASSSGDMNHVLAFTQRSLISGDTLTLTFTITLG